MIEKNWGGEWALGGAPNGKIMGFQPPMNWLSGERFSLTSVSDFEIFLVKNVTCLLYILKEFILW